MAADGKTGGGRGVTPPHRTIPTTLAWVRTRWWVTPPPPGTSEVGGWSGSPDPKNVKVAG